MNAVKDEKDSLRVRCQTAVKAVSYLNFGIVLMSVEEFCSLGRLCPYERLRDNCRVKILDRYVDAQKFIANARHCIFFSHQWLGWEHPDPTNIHYETMVRALG